MCHNCMYQERNKVQGKSNKLTKLQKAIAAFNAWAHSRASIFSSDDERVIGQGIIAKCQLEGLNPVTSCVI